MVLPKIQLLVALIGVLLATVSSQGINTRFTIRNSCPTPVTIGWFVPGMPSMNSGNFRCDLTPGQTCEVLPPQYNFTVAPITFREESTYTDVRFGIAVNYTNINNKVFGKDLFATQSAGSVQRSLGVTTPPGTFPAFLYCGAKAGNADCTFGEWTTRTHSFIFETNTGGTFALEWCAQNQTNVGNWQPCLRKNCKDGRSNRTNRTLKSIMKFLKF